MNANRSLVTTIYEAGTVTDAPPRPGVPYEIGSVPDVTAGNAPDYASLASQTYDRSDATTLTGRQYADDLRGGDGADTIMTGTGSDVIELDRSGNADLVTDVDFVDHDGDGPCNNQPDVSDLPDGAPLRSFDIIVTGNVSGNALPTFPKGETLVPPRKPPRRCRLRHSRGLPVWRA